MKIPEFVNKYIGIPYRSHGRSVERDGGLDCWGLCVSILREEFGYHVPAYDFYDTEAGEKEVTAIAEDQDSPWQEVFFPDIKSGDVVWLRSLRGVVHVGVMLSPHQFIHTHSKINSSIARVDDLLWRSRVVGHYRWKGERK